jgi:hypothetical protein
MEEAKEKADVKEETAITEIEQPQEIPEINRNELTLQHFMNDMSLIGYQTRDPRLNKPTFYYGDGSVTNYLLWLILAELMILNNKMDKQNG